MTAPRRTRPLTAKERARLETQLARWEAARVAHAREIKHLAVAPGDGNRPDTIYVALGNGTLWAGHWHDDGAGDQGTRWRSIDLPPQR